MIVSICIPVIFFISPITSHISERIWGSLSIKIRVLIFLKSILYLDFKTATSSKILLGVSRISSPNSISPINSVPARSVLMDITPFFNIEAL